MCYVNSLHSIPVRAGDVDSCENELIACSHRTQQLGDQSQIVDISRGDYSLGCCPLEIRTMIETLSWQIEV